MPGVFTQPHHIADIHVLEIQLPGDGRKHDKAEVVADHIGQVRGAASPHCGRADGADFVSAPAVAEEKLNSLSGNS